MLMYSTDLPEEPIGRRIRLRIAITSYLYKGCQVWGFTTQLKPAHAGIPGASRGGLHSVHHILSPPLK